MFVLSERGIMSWQKLKPSLADEIGSNVNSAHLHLAEWKITKDTKESA